MSKLLSANFYRLWITKSFWLTIAFMFCIETMICLLLLEQADTLSMDYLLFMTSPGIGIIASIF